jgi:hypothetical protein
MRAFGEGSAGNVGGVGYAVKSGVLYPASHPIGSVFAFFFPIFGTNRRQTATLPGRVSAD